MTLSKFQRALVLLIQLWSFAACSGRSVQFSTDQRIIERSRQEKPEWAVSVQPGRSAPLRPWQFGQGDFEYIVSKNRILDLTLGLDQAYQMALTNMRVQLHSFLREYWQERGSLGPLHEEDLRLLNAKLDKILEMKVTESLVHDMYYEKVAFDDSKELLPLSYTVFVRMKMDQTQVNELMKEVKKACQESPRPHLQQLAQNRQAFPADL